LAFVSYSNGFFKKDFKHLRNIGQLSDFEPFLSAAQIWI